MKYAIKIVEKNAPYTYKTNFSLKPPRMFKECVTV